MAPARRPMAFVRIRRGTRSRPRWVGSISTRSLRRSLWPRVCRRRMVRAVMTVKWDCTDALSGPASAQVSDTKSSDGSGQTANGLCADKAGNTKSASLGGINIDTVAPSIALASRLPAANGDGWNNSDVTVKWDCTDALSGPASAQVSDTKSSDGSGQTANGLCADKAGNTKSASLGGINIDKT